MWLQIVTYISFVFIIVASFIKVRRIAALPVHLRGNSIPFHMKRSVNMGILFGKSGLVDEAPTPEFFRNGQVYNARGPLV